MINYLIGARGNLPPFDHLFLISTYNTSRKPPGCFSIPEQPARLLIRAGEMLHTVTRSACSTGIAHTFLGISNINEAALGVNSQHVACNLKGNCARAAPPNLLLSSSDCRRGVCGGEGWSRDRANHGHSWEISPNMVKSPCETRTQTLLWGFYSVMNVTEYMQH